MRPSFVSDEAPLSIAIPALRSRIRHRSQEAARAGDIGARQGVRPPARTLAMSPAKVQEVEGGGVEPQ